MDRSPLMNTDKVSLSSVKGSSNPSKAQMLDPQDIATVSTRSEQQGAVTQTQPEDPREKFFLKTGKGTFVF